MFYQTYNSPLWLMIITSDWVNITWLYFEWQKYFPDLKYYKENKDLEIFGNVKNWLNEYFAWKKPNFQLPLKFEWTDFQKSVWKILLEIPYWKTTTYGEIAKKLWIMWNGARAIGWAVGRNKISIIVPCHRVIWTNWKLTGYAGGIDRKEKLLELEK
jgi:methylated-DNA-[protein]-cysteine S-methyltransferase